MRSAGRAGSRSAAQEILGPVTAPRVAEFFAGAGLVRMALEPCGFQFVFANDIDETKRQIYESNFGGDEFLLGDVRRIRASQIPDVELATASFPCTDLSLAGDRAGLKGSESGLVRQFLRILGEMKDRKPRTVMLENVPGFATSNHGRDLRETIRQLNKLGYVCDILTVDARWFVPQSRLRVFIVGITSKSNGGGDWIPLDLRPSWIARFARENPDLKLKPAPLTAPSSSGTTLAEIVERFDPMDEIWWNVTKAGSFLSTLSPLQAARLEALRRGGRLSWATAYRRTRQGKPMWEIRSDDIAGCLRTTRGGSSRQALVEAGCGNVRLRWMTAREYARLQGVPEMNFGGVSESQARFALGDAVCVPAVAWLGRNYLSGLMDRGPA